MTSPRSRKTSAPTRKPAARKTPQTQAIDQYHELALAGQRDAPLSLSSRAIFWSPRYMSPSPTLVHLPFLFWLIESTRPASVVQLGLRDGVGFMGLCQAIDKLGLETVCMGLDLPNDPDAKLCDKLRKTHASLYSDFSFILTDELGRAARHMRSAKIDLLVIDAVVDEAFVASLQAHWTDLLSDHAVIVLHAPEENFANPEAKALHDNLVQTHSTVSFPQAQPGLDVILFGENQPDRLQHLAQLELGAPGYLSARSVFTRLGQGIENAQSAHSKTFALEKAKASVKTLEVQLTDLERDYKAAKEQIEDAQRSEDAQIGENAALQAKIFDLQQALDAARAESAKTEEINDLRKSLQKRDDALKDLQDTLSSEQAKRKSHWTKLEAAEAEKAALADQLAQAEKDAKAQAAHLQELEAGLAQEQTSAEAQRAELAKLQDALSSEQAKRKSHWTKLEAAEAEKAAFADQLAQAEHDAKAQAETNNQALSDAREKLKLIQGKRLQLWEEYEALKLRYQSLLHAKETVPANDDASSDV